MSEIFKGATDVTRYVMIVDSSTGAPETAVTITDLDMQYTRNRSTPAAKVDMVALAATDTAHTDGRGIAVDATSSPGLYRIDWPDAAFATGVDKVMLVVIGTGFAPAVEHIDLVNVNNQVAYVPNAAADAAGGLPISDAGGLDMDSIKTDTAAILVDTAEIGTAGAGLTNINLPNQTMDITGSLSGSVGSVSGAVGSVTGLTASDVGAIKTKTDNLTFTVAGQVDANIQSVNDVTVNGDGGATPWGP